MHTRWLRMQDLNLAKDCDKELKDAEKALTEIVSEDGTLKEFKGEVKA